MQKSFSMFSVRSVVYFSLQCMFLAFTHLVAGSELSLKEKVGQLLIVHFNGAVANDQAEKLVKEAYVGGFIYYNWANQLDSSSQVHELTRSLQALAKPTGIPLWIAVDQEGGAVNRLKKGFTIFPGNYALGQTHQSLLAGKSALAMGRELRSVGVNLNLAPVIDIYSQPLNPVIGIRSFGNDPQEVTQFGKSALKGYQEAGILAVLKHYPGHGDTTVDSHDSLPILKHSKTRLEQVELFPFNQLASKSDAIMTSHLFVPVLDPENCVTFSPAIVEEYLRHQMKFDGLILTDSLVMQGLLEVCPSIEEAAIRAFVAGHDLIVLGGKQLLTHQKGFELMPEDVIRIHHALLDAVRKGRISQERLDDSVDRILALKEKYASFTIPPLKELERVKKENQELAQQIANQAILSQELPLPLSLAQSKVAIIAPQLLKDEIEKTTLLSLGKETRVFYFEALPSADASTLCHWADDTLILSYKSWKNKDLLEALVQLQKESARSIVLIVGDPQDASSFQEADVLMATFGPSSFSLQAALNIIMGKGKHE